VIYSIRDNTDNNQNSTARVIRDSRFVSALPSRANKPSFTNTSAPVDLDQAIAMAFERRDIVELTEMICAESPIYMKKTRNSPLYVFVSPNSHCQNRNLKEKIGIVETALYLLINDDKTDLKDIAKSYKLITDRNSIYKPSSKLLDAFNQRLG